MGKHDAQTEDRRNGVGAAQEGTYDAGDIVVIVPEVWCVARVRPPGAKLQGIGKGTMKHSKSKERSKMAFYSCTM